MKPVIYRFFAFLSLSTKILSAATSSTVGSISVEIPKGNSTWVPPFVAVEHFSGIAISVEFDKDATLVELNTTSLLPSSLSNHYLELQDGPNAGLTFDIENNQAGSVTLAGDAIAYGLTGSHRIIVREHLTVATLFPDGADFAPLEDTLTLFNADGSRLDLYWNPATATWIDVMGADKGAERIFPCEGLVFYSSTDRSLSVGADGQFTHIKSTPTRVPVYAGAVNLIGPSNPLPSSISLGDLGFKDDFAVFSDSANIFLQDGSLMTLGTYLTDGGATNPGTNSFINGMGQTSDNVPLEAGRALAVSVNLDKVITLAAPSLTAP
ncbi:MAG: hypothetical protein ACSHYB_12845 [Roseibacillus sp.]